MRGAARLPRYRVLAAGVAVTVALCLSLAGTIRVMPLRAMPGSHVVRAMALGRQGSPDDNPECSAWARIGIRGSPAIALL